MKMLDSDTINNTIQGDVPAVETLNDADKALLQKAEAMAAESVNYVDPTSKEEQLAKFDKDYDPMMAPSGSYGLFLPKFIDLVNGLSSKSVRRLINALVAYPLEDVFVNKKNEDEFHAYQMGEHLLNSKYLMLMHTAFQHEEKQRLSQQLKDASTEAAKSIQETNTVESVESVAQQTQEVPNV